jgi:hypothetical protein
LLIIQQGNHTPNNLESDYSDRLLVSEVRIEESLLEGLLFYATCQYQPALVSLKDTGLRITGTKRFKEDEVKYLLHYASLIVAAAADANGSEVDDLFRANYNTFNSKAISSRLRRDFPLPPVPPLREFQRHVVFFLFFLHAGSPHSSNGNRTRKALERTLSSVAP